MCGVVVHRRSRIPSSSFQDVLNSTGRTLADHFSCFVNDREKMSAVVKSMFCDAGELDEDLIQDQRVIFWWYWLTAFGTSVHERVGLLFNIKLLIVYFVKYLNIKMKPRQHDLLRGRAMSSLFWSLSAEESQSV